ncbi:Cobalt-zinc-cadmium resistance protein CzcD [Listeria aquatica FSL S10-1188]|uniref:Cobalt-zinc-cadmium resistance protein CzcD n=1 Tax=Listeria aquatica FSL S10-1188 TaxID=1265818 RepID=W7AT74_9LIST|nr:Cobalt-zinc-cadmium resistance protein CzcD [Listeria aquatica FSL S10-1188]
MGQHHSHDHHGHGHHHTHSANKKALFISFILIAGFMVAEVIGGILTNSLALLSDAGHMLSDAVALGLSLLAFKFGGKSSERFQNLWLSEI